ncbi:MAG: lipocalin family protein [Pseudomonadota bacterium]
MRYSEMKARENEHDWRRARALTDGNATGETAALRWLTITGIGVLALILFGCSSPQYRDTDIQMTTHGPVDLSSYAGRWFEVARFPNTFEEGCVGVTADYALAEDGTVSVLNTCRQGTLNGPVSTAEGVATVASADQDRLRVNFVPWLPFAAGDYWILYTDYQISVVGTPSGNFGWILARAPTLTGDDLERALAVLRRNGYDTSALEYPAPLPG